jgi:undecaprenyl diphosphate synthase
MEIIGSQDRKISLEKLYQKYNLDPQKIPEHIAIIMDGNGRWAKKRLLPRNLGHKEGAEALRRTVKVCEELNIHYLSVYAFSTENWKRPEKEVGFLISFFMMLIKREAKELNKQGVRVKCIGYKEPLSDEFKEHINYVENLTKDNTVLQLNLLMNYGSRCEIVEACKRIVESKVKVEDISEKTFADFLFTKNIPDPDILIRTGGDYRVSNYLLWQIAYSELFVVDTLWPDFDKEVLVGILQGFGNRDRRFGGL